MPGEKNHVIIGDLHGNPAKLMLALYKHGVIPENEREKLNTLLDCYQEIRKKSQDILTDPLAVKETDYSRRTLKEQPLKQYIESIEELTQDEAYLNLIRQYAELSNSIQFDQTKAHHIHLLGDHLGDRGANDFLMLDALVNLKEKCRGLSVIYSNHDHDFFQQQIDL